MFFSEQNDVSDTFRRVRQNLYFRAWRHVFYFQSQRKEIQINIVKIWFKYFSSLLRINWFRSFSRITMSHQWTASQPYRLNTNTDCDLMTDAWKDQTTRRQTELCRSSCGSGSVGGGGEGRGGRGGGGFTVTSCSSWSSVLPVCLSPAHHTCSDTCSQWMWRCCRPSAHSPDSGSALRLDHTTCHMTSELSCQRTTRLHHTSYFWHWRWWKLHVAEQSWFWPVHSDLIQHQFSLRWMDHNTDVVWKERRL